MKISTITKSLGVLALLGSSAGMAATVSVIPSSATPLVGQTFTLTVQSDVVNSLAATMQVFYDATKVQWLSGAMPASGPFQAALGGTYIKNTAYTSNSVFDIVTNTETTIVDGTYTAVILTFQALVAGAANIVINDDGGGCCGWFSNPEADFIPVDYNQASVTVTAPVVPVPAAAWLFVSALGGLATLKRRVK